MKRFFLEEDERRTLLDMGTWHAHARVRRRAQALVRLAQGVAPEQVAQEFDVHVNSLRGWIERWRRAGLVGLHDGHSTGRPRKLSPAVAERLRQVVVTEGWTVPHIMRRMEELEMPLRAGRATVSRWLKELGFTYKSRRNSVKRSKPPTRWRAPASKPERSSDKSRQNG